MRSLVLVLLVVGVICNEVRCNTVSTTDQPESTEQQDVVGSSKIEGNTEERLKWWRDLLMPRRGTSKKDDPESSPAMAVDRRKSRLIGSLAFLAGLGVGGLAGAASSTMKTYAKVPAPPLALNLGATRFSPYVTAFYDPFVAQPYLYPNPFALYPFVDPPRLQQSLQNGLAHQNHPLSQLLALYGLKGPAAVAADSEEEYEEEEKAGKKSEKISSGGYEEAEDRAELRVEADRNAEEKMVIRAAACGTSKDAHSDQNNLPHSSTGVSFRQANVSTNNLNQNTTMRPTNFTDNSTLQNNRTEYPPFIGYYGGHPQNVDHLDFTTQTNAFRYPDFRDNVYDLPHDRPANFYPADKYNFYENPVNSYPNGQFLQDHEYVGNDFNRVLYTPENPSLSDGFRPVL